MIRIYAFCGMGKTTLCNNHGYIDDDMFYPTRSTIRTTDIVLTNEPTDNCDMYFLPPCYETAFSKLSKDKQKFFNEYTNLLKNQYNLVKEKYNPIIKDYITNEDIIERINMKITKEELKTYRYSKLFDYEGNLTHINIVKDDKIIDQVKSKRFSLIKYLEKQGITVDENEDFNTDILKLAMIYNVDFPVVYTMTAPYTHEYCIPSHKCDYIDHEYCERVTADDWYNELPTVLYKYMLKNHQDFDYEQLLEKIKLTIKNNEIKEVNGSTYRGQPLSDELLQTLKHELVNHLPLSKNGYMSYIPEKHYAIKEDFGKLYNKYLKEV